MRLEQRIGRVDRIGQRRTVHAVHLIGAGTGETRILSRLQTRIAKARTEIGAPDPVGADEELAVTQLVLAGTADAQPKGATPDSDAQARIFPDLRDAAGGEVDRLAFARRLVAHNHGHGGGRLGVDGPWIARLRRCARAALRSRIVLLWRVSCDNAHGRTVESTLVPVSVHLSEVPSDPDRAWIEELLRHVEADAHVALDRATANWRTDTTLAVRNLVDMRVARERAILETSTGARPQTFQPGLFD